MPSFLFIRNKQQLDLFFLPHTKIILNVFTYGFVSVSISIYTVYNLCITNIFEVQLFLCRKFRNPYTLFLFFFLMFTLSIDDDWQIFVSDFWFSVCIWPRLFFSEWYLDHVFWMSLDRYFNLFLKIQLVRFALFLWWDWASAYRNRWLGISHIFRIN